MAIIIKKCTCKNQFQDKEYGDGQRVCNTTDRGDGGVRCTVCGSIIENKRDKK